MLVIILMLVSFVFACIVIPYNMNEYSVPIYFRDSNSNVFLDFLRMRIVAFAYFMMMSGCLPHFNFYNVNVAHKCLHTSSDRIDIVWTDSYQFILVLLVWTVNLPMIAFGWLGVMRDNLRYICIPVIIATAIF